MKFSVFSPEYLICIILENMYIGIYDILFNEMTKFNKKLKVLRIFRVLSGI